MGLISRAINLYKDTYKQEDFVWAKYATRPLTAFLLACLGDLKITPNQLTIFNLFVGIAGAACMAFYPGYLGLWIAWILLQLAFTIDCMDGMQARAKKWFSPVGQKLDYLIDELKAMFLYPAVGYRLYVETGEVLYLYLALGGSCVVASSLTMTTFMRSSEYTGEQGHARRSYSKGPVGWLKRGLSFIINYPSWILIPVIFNRMDIFFVVSLATYVLYAAYAFLQIMLKTGRTSHYEMLRKDNNK